MSAGPREWTDAALLADAIVEQTSGHIVLAIPLGLGKANHFVNAVYRRAASDQTISLKIYTALTLEKPKPKSELEARFLRPVIDRLFDCYVDLDYATALHAGTLPANIEINEFFLAAGKWLGVPSVQQNYISANYTDVYSYILDVGVNVLAQMVAARPGGQHEIEDDVTYSLSCNPDITVDLLTARGHGDADFQLIGEINDELPFMGRDAEIPAAEFAHLLTGHSAGTCLFNAPKRPVRLADYAAGFHAARLIPDGGTLQIGIGSIGDAIAHALIMRHKNNTAYLDIVSQLAPVEPPAKICEDGPFIEGLYGASEMLVDTFLNLIEAGVVKREVDGCVVNAAFFLGPTGFYRDLREIPRPALDRIGMTSVRFVNDAHEQFEKKQRDRKNARFVNNGMKATLLGAVVSDGLESGQVISGVGGQFDFVRQAFALKGARSIIILNAVREHGSEVTSNIVWNYAHQTIPRHLRDIVVTEYGVADLRGKSDVEVILAMLSVADARFHKDLIAAAQNAGKLPLDFKALDHWKFNTPDRIESVLCAARDQGILPDFPFGSDFTDVELDLLPALESLKQLAGSKWTLARIALTGATKGPPGNRELTALDRMGLARPNSMEERFYRYLLRGALKV